MDMAVINSNSLDLSEYLNNFLLLKDDLTQALFKEEPTSKTKGTRYLDLYETLCDWWNMTHSINLTQLKLNLVAALSTCSYMYDTTRLEFIGELIDKRVENIMRM